MASKLSIFLVFVGLAQSSVGFDKPSTCAPTLQITAILESIKFAETTERLGYLRSAEVIMGEISAVMAQRVGGGDIEAGDDNMRAQIAQNGSYTGPLNAVWPNSQSIKIIQPDYDMISFQQSQVAGRWKLNQEIFDGIKAAQGDDFQKAKDEISKHSKSAHDLVSKGVKMFFESMTNGSKSLPDNALSTISCVQAQTEAMMHSGIRAIFEEIYTLAEALHSDGDSKPKIDKHELKIVSFHRKATAALSTGFGYKFQALRNIALKQYFDKSEIVTALCAMDSALSL